MRLDMRKLHSTDKKYLDFSLYISRLRYVVASLSEEDLAAEIFKLMFLVFIKTKPSLQQFCPHFHHLSFALKEQCL